MSQKTQKKLRRWKEVGDGVSRHMRKILPNYNLEFNVCQIVPNLRSLPKFTPKGTVLISQDMTRF